MIMPLHRSLTRQCDPIEKHTNAALTYEVTMGEIPSSMRVPRLEAKMTRIQYRGSEESDETIPKSGICEQTK